MRTVIFDLDGTLIDTEKYFKVFWRKAAAAFGYSMSEEQALQLRSLGRPYAPALLQEWFGEEFDYLAVRIVREGGADILMKGIINTDNLLRAILDKEHGLLPKGKILTHLAVMQIPTYDKLLFFSDAAVIPRPTLQQRIEMIWYAIHTCRHFGIEQPRIALIHCTEKVSAKFPHSLDYVNIVELAEAGEFGNVIIDGPLDVKTSCEKTSGNIKGIVSPIDGEADVLIFPNIESGNAFYKAVSLFSHADMAGLLQGPSCPVVLPSRSDSGLSKYYSIAMACLTSGVKEP